MQDWAEALKELAPEMHEVDRDACLIWFQFFPSALHQLLQSTSDRTKLETFYQFKGTYRLAEIADTSHWFLYGHRYWLKVKQAIAELGPSSVRDIAGRVDAPMALALPISAVGLMTLEQCGPGFLNSEYVPPQTKQTPEQILKSRATDGKSGLFARSKPRVIFREDSESGWFPLVPGQHVTTAAELDKRVFEDPRCSPTNGPIPVDCRSGSCGTCWVGVLGGGDRLAPPEAFERKRMEYFGYWDSPLHNPERPLIRLACQTVANGSCSVVIPPWNGVWGKSRRDKE